MKRTHTCGELTNKNIDNKVVLNGWVHSRRDHGGVIFIDLRDRYGLTQIVFNPEFNKDSHKEAEHLRREDVLHVEGIVKARGEGLENPKLKTGKIEVFINKLIILNKAETPPIEIDDRVETNEDVALKYRYLDLRKPMMQKYLITRHKITNTVRNYFDKNNFLEIETPMLAKSTPEGARDYLVPARVNPGKFYALPQSPQIFKQLLMVSGFDRYMQIVKCFRDEDLRADRQPEFTQIDVEMSFVEEEDIYNIMDGMIKDIWRSSLNYDVPIPIQRITYKEAMERFGSDKPDMRFGLELVEVGDVVENSDFKVFTDTIKNKGMIKAINIKAGAEKFSRKDIDSFIEYVKIYKAKGLAWMKVTKDNKLESSIVKFFMPDIQEKLKQRLNTEPNDLLLFVGDQKHKIVYDALGNLRIHIAKKLNLLNKDEFKFVWVTEFPLFEYSEEEGRYVSVHHPFTSPYEEDLKYLETDKGKIRSKGYDLACNGVELGGGSIRIHKSDLQDKMFTALGISKEEAEMKFGFLLEAFKYGAPPHGGIAFGLDRIVSIVCKLDTIRDVIAFPKNKAAQSLMDNCPNEVDEKQLQELHIKLDIIREAKKEELFDKIKDSLDREKIEYEVIEHRSVYTSEEAAKVRGTSLSQGAKALICKTEKGFVQAVISAATELNLEKLQQIENVEKIDLANAIDVKKLAGVSIGAVPPFGNLFGVKMLVDKKLTENEFIAFNAGLHTKSIRMKAKDLVKITGAKVKEFSR